MMVYLYLGLLNSHKLHLALLTHLRLVRDVMYCPPLGLPGQMQGFRSHFVLS